MQEMMLGSGGGSGDEYEHPYGDRFLGEVSVNRMITGNALASHLGLTAGTAQHSDEPWLKFITGEGLTLYIAKKTYRHTIPWDDIHAVNAVYGGRTVLINGSTYKVRLLKGANIDPVTASSQGQDPLYSYRSEYNRLFYPIVHHASYSPRFQLSGEGIMYGEQADYVDSDLGMGYNGGDGQRFWCQETIAPAGTHRVIRGASVPNYFSFQASSTRSRFLGWRPVLELVE